MMTISKIKNIEYYDEWSSEDYYQRSGNSVGQWDGYLSKVLGLKGNIESAVYKNVMAGLAPNGGKSLVENYKNDHVPGWDCCFTMPKSGSILAIIDESGDVQTAHDKAVSEAIRFLEEHAAWCRRGKGGHNQEKLTSLLALKYRHYESRADQPNIHTHVLIKNLGLREDKSYGTIDSKYLYKFKMAAGAIYRTELSRNLRKLGYSVIADGDSFAIEGISKEICHHYSDRQKQIKKALIKIGAKTSSSLIGEKITLSTRKAKSNTPVSELKSKWKAELISYGYDSETVNEIKADKPVVAKGFVLMDQALEELTEKKSVFRKQDLYQNLAVQAQTSEASAETISHLAKFTMRHVKTHYLGRDHKGNELFTTEEVLSSEKELIQLAKKLKNQKFRFPDKHIIKKAVSMMEKKEGFLLDDEQLEAIDAALSVEQISIISGAAGSGKSSVMAAINFAYKSLNINVLGASVAKKAADSLQEGTGINSVTVAKLLHDFEKGQNPIPRNSVLVIDEAGQLGVIQLKKLLQMASHAGAKLILSGDDRQLRAIQRPGALSYLTKCTILGSTNLNVIRRQRDLWQRGIVGHLKDGNSLAAIKEIDKRGFTNFSNNYTESIDLLVKRYFDFQVNNSKKSSLVIAHRWKDVIAISEKIRTKLQDQGVVSKESHVFDCTVSDLNIKQDLSIGERVRFTKNDYRLKVTNGSFGTIQNMYIDQANNWVFSIELDNGEKVDFSEPQYQNELGKLQLVQAYATTIYSSQGLTVDAAFVFFTSGMDRANSYVSGSRHKESCHWFFNNEEIDAHIENQNVCSLRGARINQISKWMQQDNTDKLAIEYLNSHLSSARTILNSELANTA
jgi:conjugative relaxase-like TrwC/TraI family protein